MNNCVNNGTDYRSVSGVMMPFRVVMTNASTGETISTVMGVKVNVEIVDKEFQPKTKKR
jgi:outer membrane lipoprotein-sorting protein